MPNRVVEPHEGLSRLLDVLRERGWRVLGPTIRDGAIAYGEIRDVADLPAGWTDEQAPGRYRLRRRDDGAFFGYAVGPHSWKRELLPPHLRLWQARRTADAFVVEEPSGEPPRLALLGVRPCEIAAIDVQDRVLAGGGRRDPDYTARRGRLFRIAVQCGEPAGTCFCVSMGTGPRAREGFDLALTERLEGGHHELLAEAGTPAGEEILALLGGREATPGDEAAAEAVTARAAGRMGRTLEAEGVRELLYANLEHPRWDEVAKRCLGCTNCTMVCPTCFCTSVEDVTDLATETAARERVWDSCFTADHSWIHGGSVRPDIRARYRQWLTHKLASWIDQFGTSGCVGCGRCITWCPVGIDLTEEVAAIRKESA